MPTIRHYILPILACLLMTGCYHSRGSRHYETFVSGSTVRPDSLATKYHRHYGRNYNFVVKSDSLVILHQQPEERISNMHTDSVAIRRNQHIVVADIRIIKNDKIDSVWVQVARDQHTFGWVHESRLLSSVVPDDPISQFISYFSNVHLLISLFIISTIAVSYLLYYILKKNAKVVHFNDIDSFYPTLLTLTVAAAATFYSSIQLFAPSAWQSFYFHPTLNPFALPTILSLFICSVWAMIIIALAAVDDILHKLPLASAILYTSGLVGICAANYIIFSVTTLYYVGYVLLVVYVVLAIRQYCKYSKCTYRCGNCGALLKKKGKCPYCGAVNE